MINKRKGFTLIEILVVITIIGVLMAVGAVSYTTATKKARDGRRRGDLEQIRSALEMYKSTNSVYPGTLPVLVTTYINPQPHDPKCPGGTCVPSTYNDYLYTPGSSPVNSYTLQAQLEINPTEALSCSASSPRNYCVSNP